MDLIAALVEKARRKRRGRAPLRPLGGRGGGGRKRGDPLEPTLEEGEGLEQPEFPTLAKDFADVVEKGRRGRGKRGWLVRPVRGGSQMGHPFRGNQYTGGISGPKKLGSIFRRTIEISVGRGGKGRIPYTVEVHGHERNSFPNAVKWFIPRTDRRGVSAPRSLLNGHSTTPLGKFGEFIVVHGWGRGNFRYAIDTVHHQGPFDLQWRRSRNFFEVKTFSNSAAQPRPKFDTPRENAKKQRDARRLGINGHYAALMLDFRTSTAHLYINRSRRNPYSGRPTRGTYTYHGSVEFNTPAIMRRMRSRR